MFKSINTTIIIIVCLLLGLGLGYMVFGKWSFLEKKKAEEATIVIEQIKNVTKLITVEGQLNELYTYQDYLGYDVSPLRKKALIRVRAKVSAGYDFEKMQINVYPGAQKIVIRNFPAPEILSIDHDLDYYDLTEGLFNGFDTQDYNLMNKSAKAKIVSAAKESNILQKAQEQKENLLKMLELMVKGQGYQLEVSYADSNGQLD